MFARPDNCENTGHCGGEDRANDTDDGTSVRSPFLPISPTARS